MIDPAHPDYSNTPAAPTRPRPDYSPAEPAAPPVVSIITPFYNSGPIFRETATSVFRQSLQQWEWILVNDGSTDPEALRLLEEFRRQDARIRVVDHARNQGLSAARNTGFREARAELVFQLDADDLIEPTTLEKMAWHLYTHPEFAFTTGYTVGFGSKQYLWRNGFHNGRGFLKENLVTATCLVRKSVHHAIGGYEEANCGGLEDWEFWLKAAAHGHWGSTIPEFLDWYRRRETGREHWNNVLDKEKADQFRARLRQRYPRLWEQGFPELKAVRPQLCSPASHELPFRNQLVKQGPRLLFLVPHFELGGADKFNLDLIGQLQHERGYAVTVVGTRKSPNPWLHEFQSLTPDVFPLNHFLHVSDFPLFLRYLITSRQPDVVCVSQSLLGYQLLPYLRAHFPGVPFVDYLHMEQEEWMGGGYPRYSLHYRTQLARQVVSSAHLKNWMTARGGDPGTIEVCHTNIDTGRWRRERFDLTALAKRWTVNRSHPTILYAGRICDQKQPRVFGEVMRQLAREERGFTALVAGDGPDLAQLKEFAQRAQLQQVRFVGAVPNGAMAELLALSDIFFLPSQWEGISLALYEAMAMGVVPVAAAVGGQAELVSAECGVLVQRGPNEVSDYTTALLKLLRSPELRTRMATAARQRVADCFPIVELGRKMDRIFCDAQRVVATGERHHVMPLDLAALLVAEVVEQTRATDYADTLRHESEGLLSFVKYSVQWQSAYRAGLALVQAKQTGAAIELFETSLRSATASRNPDLEFAARLEIGRALIGVDKARAETTLGGAQPLVDAVKDPGAGRALQQALELFAAAPAGAAGATPAGPRAAPLVSVVIPCYKQAHYVPEAVESVVAQTLADWELIIVNDGSPDNTSEAARELIARHPGRSIRLIEKPNGGLSSARNAGIRAARGRYILPLDADDKIRPMLLEKLAAILDAKPEVGFAYTHIQHFGALDTEYPLPDFDPATLIGKDNIACVCALFRKSAWEQTGGYNEAMREGYEDWDFWIGCVEHGWAGYCLHEPLFLYRKSGQSMLAQANRKREGLVARIVLNHPKLYDDKTRKWAGELLQSSAAGVGSTLAGRTTGAAEPAESVGHLTTGTRPRLRVTYLISSILGVTGGNQTLLRQAEEMRRRGHEVAIVTHTPKPDWFQFGTRVIQVPAAQPMAACVPPSDVVVATYFTNAAELSAVPAPVKVYYAQGDQFVFSDPAMPDNEQNRRLRELSRASYLLPGVRFVPNSNNLAGAVERLCGRPADGILPVCTDQTIFRPLQRSLPGSRFRLLIVGPDARGTESEPLLFKGIQDIHDALEILARRFPHFTAVRMSATAPDIFARFPCEFYLAPCDEMKTVLYGTSHVHIYASHYDSCPRPPQEAMAAGCAVVCTDTPGAREYCRGGENCLLVPIRSPAAIAEAVERLIKDNALREQLIQGGLATAREYPREREWNEWEALLLRFAQEAARGTSRSPEVLPLAAKAAESAKRAKAAPIKLPACALVGHLGNARESLRLRKLSVAWESTLAAIQARPFHPEAFLLLGEIAHTAGDSVSARRCAQHALSLAPGWKPPKKFLKRNLRGNVRLPWLVLPDALDPQRSPRLTVCVIARNEGQFLGQCLASVRGLAGQIVVVDTGSTDNTVEIAKEQGAEVSSFEWCDDFSAARNAAVERATGDWILMVDADEELPPENHEALRKLLRVAPVIAWRLPIVDAGQEEEGCCYVPRLFRNAPGLFYVGRVHEQVFSSLEVRRQEWGLDNRMGDAGLRHYGYQPQLVKDRRKIERNLRLLEQAIEEFPGEPNLLMNYGLELVRSGQVEKGLDHYRQAVGAMAAQSASEVAPETREMLLTQFCTQLIGLKRYAELVGLLDSPLAKAGGLSASLHFSLGLACLELGRFQEAADQMRQCLLKRAQPSLAPVHKEIRKAGPRHCLAVALEHLGQTEAAAEEFRLAMEEDPKSRPARLDYARFLAGKGQLGEALKLLFALATENPSDLPVWQAGGQLTLSRPGLLEVARNWTAEALRHAPQDSKLLQQRAEALMLSGQCDLALPLWQRLPAGSDPSLMAARLLCKIVAGDNHPSPPPQDEARVSREFLALYRRLVKFDARTVLERLNAQLEQWQAVLPTAARTLSAAMAQAREAVPA